AAQAMRRELLRLLGCALAGALVGLLAHSLAHGQVGLPPSFCGLPHVTMPPATLLLSGSAAAYASQSVSNTTASAAPTLPTVSLGSIVGADVDIEQSGIRYRVDGTTIAGTFDGSPAAAGQTLRVCIGDLRKWSAIASSTGSNAILRWRFYMQGG